ncbi:MAG: hypothetical protein M3O36_14625 [Myxococcota bacterium]|nr:hypothetical protein [Myxococcota bacterium]
MPLISIASRVGSSASLFVAAGGVDAARAVIAQRAGGQIDPELAATLARNAGDVFSSIEPASLWARALEAEPRPHAGSRRSHTNASTEVGITAD